MTFHFVLSTVRFLTSFLSPFSFDLDSGFGLDLVGANPPPPSFGDDAPAPIERYGEVIGFFSSSRMIEEEKSRSLHLSSRMQGFKHHDRVKDLP